MSVDKIVSQKQSYVHMAAPKDMGRLDVGLIDILIMIA